MAVRAARARRTALVAAAALSGLAASGCTVVLSREPVQCQSDADCGELGAEFAGTVCGPGSVCIDPPASCHDNVECTSAEGAPGLCRADLGACVPLSSQDCEVVGKVDNDEVLVFGFMNGTDGAFAPVGVPMKNSVELAFSEFAKIALGLPGGSDGRPRPIAFVACSEVADPERAARHLVEQVGVPAIIGPSSSRATLTVAQKVTTPAGVLLLSPSATSPAITDLSDQGLVWRTAPSDAIQARALALLVPNIELDLRAELGLTPDELIRVAVTVRGDAYGTGLADAALAELEFNGQSAVDNGDLLLQKVYPDPLEDPTFDAAAVAAEIAAFAPHIVLLLGTQEIAQLMSGIESSWPATQPRPRYVLPAWGKAPETLTAVGPSNDDLRRRILGTVPGLKNTNYDSFALRYKGVFGAPPDTFGTANAYDAAYLLAYATVAVRDQEISGANLSSGLAKTLGGSPLDVGPNPMNTAIKALSTGTAIDFNGASGALDFDLSTGDAPADIDVWCVARNSSGDPIFQSTGQFYSAQSGELEGAIACP